jgi:rod shape-determining protein MreD
MRRTVLAFITVAVAVIVQLTVLNGLGLPGGGVPDLVLVLVAALAITNGPVRGMITGFLAGLVLDLAPPGSAVLGEYALVFCLVGWAAGMLTGLVAKSAVRSLVMLACVVAAGEAIVAGIDRVLDPAQVSLTQIRHVLPYSIAYDFFLIPFVLAAALLGTAWASRQRVDPLEAAGVPAAESALKLVRSRPARPRPHELRLAQGTGRPHDGWVGSRPSGLDGQTGGRPSPVRKPSAPRRLRPANGVAGSAFSGPPRHPGLAARPVNLRLTSGRRGDGALGNRVGGGSARHPDLHSVRRSAARFRPHGGAPGGSAAGQFAAMVRHPPSGPGARGPAPVRFGRRRRDGSVGRPLGTGALTTAGLHQPYGAGRTAPTLRLGRTTRPRFRLDLSAARSDRKAVPNFRRAGRSGSAVAATTGLVSGGTLDQAAFVAMRRRQAAAPALHLRAGRRGDGVVGGRRQARPATPRLRARPLVRSSSSSGRRQPRFGYGRRSLLAFLASHGIGGSWLARRRVGTRASASLIRRRESVE